MDIRKGDTVLVITGKYKGRKGRVLRTMPSEDRLIVEGVNMIKRATKANPQKNIKGGIVEREAPIAVSNVLLLDPEAGKPTRVGIRVEGVNMMKRHTRPSSRNQQGGIVERERPIHVSNVMAWCEAAGKPSKIVRKVLQDGSRVRVFKVNGETISE